MSESPLSSSVLDADTYPPGPAAVPEDLLTPSAAYKRHAYLAISAVLGFVVLYFAFAGWLAWTSYHALAMAFGPHRLDISLLFVAGFTGLLAVFLFKALVFVVKRGKHNEDVELTAREHPRLFAFLHKMADEAKAPRPHRVFVSTRVNAAVFYDLSLLNLLVPSKKNLELGLGLVNALTLSELKAVIAHELGHFAQRTMAVGRWVYVGQQIAGHIVMRRDGIDRFLVGLSNTDLRVAWIGWILRLIIWAVRSLVDTMFSWVVMAERALGREMERQADLVSVSLTGSDALVHALYRTGAADTAMDRALSFINSEGAAGRAVVDLLAIQSRVLERMRTILGDPGYGRVPPLPEAGAAAGHRLFKARLAHPPKMWSTHPPNAEREDNAKRRYLPAVLDERSAWVLFEDPQGLRERVTREMYIKGKRPEQVPSIEESLQTLDKEMEQPYFDPSYRGAYLARSPVHIAEQLHQLYDPEPRAGDGAAVAGALAALYPESLAGQLTRRRELLEERALLKAVDRGHLELHNKRLNHRGQEHHRRELPALLAQVERELEEVERELAAHDRRCRTVHLAAARAMGETQPGWEAYLRGALGLLHYADHRERDLDDAIGALANAVSIATADGRVSQAEHERVLVVARELYDTLSDVHEQAARVELGPEIARRLETSSWEEKLGELKLSEPHSENLGQWLSAIDSWAGSASSELAALRLAALAALLTGEQQVAQAIRQGEPPPPPPEPAPRAPERYRAFLPGHGRPIQNKLGWWDRFATADGFLPGAARLVVAGSIVAASLWVSSSVNQHAAAMMAVPAIAAELGAMAELTVVNGLDRAVVANADAAKIELAPGEHGRMVIPYGYGIDIGATTAEGEPIESFSLPVQRGHAYVYNIAQATQVLVWSPQNGAEPVVGTRRWSPVAPGLMLADRAVARAAAQASAVRAAGARRMLIAQAMSPYQARMSGIDPAELTKMAAGHTRWDRVDSPGLSGWMSLMQELDSGQLAEVLARRLEQAPADVMLRRLEQELAPDVGAVCAQNRQRAEEETAGPDEHYLAARCLSGAAHEKAVRAAARRWPNHPWLAAAVGYLEAARHDWAKASEQLELARRRLPGENFEILLARVRRAEIAPGAPELGPAELAELIADEPLLGAMMMSPHAEEVAEPMRRIHAAMAAGQIEEAHRQAVAAGYEETLLPLLAASEGADPALAARALRLPAERAIRQDAAALLGLALRGGGALDPGEAGPAAAYRARLLELVGAVDAPALARFLDEVTKAARGGRIAAGSAGERALQAARLEHQAGAYMVAAVALGERCPAPWRHLAKQLLFVSERPYLR